MGYYQEQLDKLMAVEASGFNPYTESYSARIGQIQSFPNAVDGTTDPPTYSNEELKEAFEMAGVENTILDDEGLNTLYNQADDLGLDRQRLVDTKNRLLPKEEQIFINTGGTMAVQKQKPPKEENVNYGKYYNAQEKTTTRKRENSVTGEVYEKYGTSKEDIERFKKEGELYRTQQEENFQKREAERKKKR